MSLKKESNMDKTYKRTKTSHGDLETNALTDKNQSVAQLQKNIVSTTNA